MRTTVLLTAAGAADLAAFIDQVAKENNFNIPPMIDGHLTDILLIGSGAVLTFFGWLSHKLHRDQDGKDKVALANEAVGAKEIFKATPSPLAASLATVNKSTEYTKP